MEILETEIMDLYILKGKVHSDIRGGFQKVIYKEILEYTNLNIDIKEIYYSVSRKNVIRGMHFQLPPDDCVKVVYVSKGSIIDVVVDIRKSSPTYSKHLAFNLSHSEGTYLYLPSGIAHGFLSLENDTVVNYLQSAYYSAQNDRGILYNSFGYDWNVCDPIMSERDRGFPTLCKFTEESNSFI